MLRASPPSNLVGLSVIIRVLSSPDNERDNYVGNLRYHYRSRDWSPAYPRTSITVISEEKIQGGTLSNPKGQKVILPHSRNHAGIAHMVYGTIGACADHCAYDTDRAFGWQNHALLTHSQARST